MRLALFQPDIPQNAGTLLRMAACLNFGVDIIEPCGFILDDKRMRRAGMDYLDQVDLVRHASWEKFYDHITSTKRQLLLLSTKASIPYTDYEFRENDVLLMGRESAGVPEEVHEAATQRLIIPMKEGMRSLNVAVSAAMVMGEALRQTQSFP